MRAPTPLNEPARVDTLRELELLDTEAEGVFDDIVLLAAHVCGTPIALMSLVDAKRQWFKARVGVDVRETDRDSSFCAHGIIKPDEMMIVPDATKDARFADNPLVLGDPQIRFYAGAPLVTHDGHALGTLCVIDRQPRELTAEQEAALRTLRRSLVAELELRRATRALARSHQELDQRVRDRTAELQAGKEQFRTLVECTHDMVQSVDRDGRFLFVNELWRRTLGHDEADVAKARVFDVIHPDSLAHCQELFQRVMQGESVSDIEAKFRAWDGRTVIVE
jgi:PAS domain S-box-containing protein